MGKWLCIIAAFLLVTSGCGSDTPTRLNTFTPLTSIIIEADLNKLAPGTSTPLIARGSYSGLFTRDITSQVTWSSEQTDLADFLFTVTGRIKAISPGTATITASLDGIEATFNLTVTDAVITGIAVTPQSLSLPLGLTQDYKATGTFSDNTTQDLTFDATWSSFDLTVATVSNEVDSKGVVSALQTGTTSISATFDGTSGSADLTVMDAIPLSIDIISSNTSVLSLSTQNYSAMGNYSDGSTVDVTTKATWTSNNTTVATIAVDGTVKALTPGTTTIIANINGVEGTSDLTVTGGVLQSIALTLDDVSNNELINGTTSRISAVGTFNNGTSRNITKSIETWDDEAKAYVEVLPDEGNLVWLHALNDTTQTILSASYGSISGEKSLVITAPDLNIDSLSIPEQAVELSSGTSAQLSLRGTFSNASNQDLTPSAVWSADMPLTATVGDDGLDKGRIHAVTDGTSKITATYDGQTATTTVTVKTRTLDGLTISAVSSPTLIAGTQKEFRATASYSDGFTQDITADALWSIDDTNIAQFSDVQADPGLIVAVDAGTTNLTAKFGDMEDSEILTVSQ